MFIVLLLLLLLLLYTWKVTKNLRIMFPLVEDKLFKRKWKIRNVTICRFQRIKLYILIIIRGIIWENVEWMGEMRNTYNSLIGTHQGKRAFLVLKVDGRIILKHVLGNCVKDGLDLADSEFYCGRNFRFLNSGYFFIT
jgi:hypothetical protein